MTNTLQIEEVAIIDPALLTQLMDLIIDVVDDGASIGFLPPLVAEEARSYLEGVSEAGVVLWIARKDDKLCGTVQLHMSRKANGAHRAEVAKLMVRPKYRRTDIGKALMHAVENRAKAEQRSLLVLDTRPDDPSNKLYASLGFVAAGSIPRYARSANGELDATIFYYKELLD